jgi:NAD(P)-dependent dehydrogenase (short-subunit alcohol dehydrogenase family)
MGILDGKTILVTGATDGIGRQTALELTRMGARVFVHGRSPERAEKTVREIEKETGNSHVERIVADLSSMEQVRMLAEEVRLRCGRLDVLLNNAGTYMKSNVTTVDGFETTFAVNHLAPFLLTRLLEPLLRSSVPARVVTVSSVAHMRAQLDMNNLQGERRFDPYGAYALSKLANILFSNEFAARMHATGVTSNCLHPGVISTKLLRIGFDSDGASVEEGAATSVHLASSPLVGAETGKYFVKKQAVLPAPVARDAEACRAFWEASEALLSRFLGPTG